MTLTSRKLAEYALDLEYGNLPSEVVHEAKRLLLNMLGPTIAGYAGPVNKVIRKTLGEIGGREECTIIGSSVKIPCPDAALINGSMSHYWDFRDWHYWGMHPSGNIAPALAIAEREHASGKDLITAIVLGYEVVCKLTKKANVESKGYDQGTYWAYSVPVMAGKLMNLSEDQIVDALGISGSTGSVLSVITGATISMFKVPRVAHVSRNAIFATLLAKNGLTGPKEVLEGKNGLCEVISGDFDIEKFGGQNGEPFEIMKTSMKAFPVGSAMQTSVFATIETVTKNDIKPEDVEKIKVKVIPPFAAVFAVPERFAPETYDTAQNSLPYGIAAAVVDRDISINQWLGQSWLDPRIRSTLKKIEVTGGEELLDAYLKEDLQPSIVEITTKDGKSYSSRVDCPHGHYRNRFTDEEVKEKFLKLTSGLLDDSQTKKVIETVFNLDKVQNIGVLMDYLVI